MTDDRTRTRPRGAWRRLRPWLAACAASFAFAAPPAVAQAAHAAPVLRGAERPVLLALRYGEGVAK
jgi:hypothetical protein